MIPEKVMFTSMVVDDPLSFLLGKVMTGPIPVEWLRVRFVDEKMASIKLLYLWLEKNIVGRYTVTTFPQIGLGSRVISVAFEIDSDAVLFRIKGGEAVWMNADDE